MLWTMPLAYPLMAAIQLMCAQIGRVTGKGLAANIKAVFPPFILRAVVGLLLVANILNIAADVAAMGEVAELVTGLSRHATTVALVLITLLLQIFIPYHRYVFFLKWLTLSLLAYAAVLFTVHVPWGEVAIRTFVPRLVPDAQAATVIVAIFGTTISPYLFFWQASEEVEDMQRTPGSLPLLHDPRSCREELRRIRWDTWSGMLYSNLTAYLIMLATAVTLHAAGVTKIETAAQAADALRPLAGDFAFLLFALGVLGVGLIGVPVLAGSGAYALCEAMGWKWGLERRASDARAFYGVIAASVLIGLVIQYSPISPMEALFWSAVINGIVAVPLMAIVILIACRKSVMGAFRPHPAIIILGWAATAVMTAAAARMFIRS
jgi:Mn2+/Fe2+ NRAMP family transporter